MKKAATSGNQLHALRNHATARVLHQHMNMIGRDHVIKYRESETLLRLEYPVQVAEPVPCSERSGSSRSVMFQTS